MTRRLSKARSRQIGLRASEMKYVAQSVGWICVTLMVGGCMAMAYLSDKDSRASKNAVAIACVQGGGQWVSSWRVFECVRPSTAPRTAER